MAPMGMKRLLVACLSLVGSLTETIREGRCFHVLLVVEKRRRCARIAEHPAMFQTVEGWDFPFGRSNVTSSA